jgi:NADH dehydrogenase
MGADPGETPADPVVVLGAGYAGLTVAHEVYRQGRGKIPVVVVDRQPVHELRTQLYEIGRIAGAGDDSTRWTVPLTKVFERTSVTARTASVQGIDLAAKTVQLDTGPLPYGSLAICLGSVPAYYGVPGAAEHSHSVYQLAGAQRLGRRLKEVVAASNQLAGERRPRVVVVGGGSTGTEVAAEIASTDWAAVVGAPVRPLEVLLLTGSLPFLAGLPTRLVEHARRLLGQAGVGMIYGYNVAEVSPDRVRLEDGTVLRAEVVIWCAGLEAPPLVRHLPVAHGKGGRIAVTETLEIPDHPGAFAVGDVIEFQDPSTGLLVPGTAQAALAEARVAGQNLAARWENAPQTPFRYRERGTLVAVGRGQGAATVRRVTLWGRPASLLKAIVASDYARSVESGSTPSGL